MFEIIYLNPLFTADQTICKVIIMENKNKREPLTPDFIVFIGDRLDNKGKSVTNNIERIAEALWDQHFKNIQTNPLDVAWVTMNPYVEPVEIDVVEFKSFFESNTDSIIFASPVWTNITNNLPKWSVSLWNTK